MNDLGRLFLSSYYDGKRKLGEERNLETASQMLSGRVRILMQGKLTQEAWSTDQGDGGGGSGGRGDRNGKVSELRSRQMEPLPRR